MESNLRKIKFGTIFLPTSRNLPGHQKVDENKTRLFYDSTTHKIKKTCGFIDMTVQLFAINNTKAYFLKNMMGDIDTVVQVETSLLYQADRDSTCILVLHHNSNSCTSSAGQMSLGCHADNHYTRVGVSLQFKIHTCISILV